jgi:ABC-2 type transport system permease protein
MLLYVFFMSINVGNIIVAYSTLYRSKETLYLLTSPVPVTSLIIVKFLDNFFYSSITLFNIAVAVLIGYGSYFHVHWTFYVGTMVLLFIPFMLLAAALAVIVLIALILLAARLGPRAVLIGAVVIYVAALYLYFRIMNPMQLVNQVMLFYPHVDVYFGSLDPPFARYLPNYWVAECLYWLMRGKPALAASHCSVLLVSCATVLVTMVLFAKGFYYRSWLASLELLARSRWQGTSRSRLSLAGRPVLESQSDAIVKKEFWQFFRDPSQWVHLGVIAVLIIVFTGSVTRFQLGLKQPFMEAVSYLVLYLFNAFLISSVAIRFVYPMISTEGQNFWAIRSAPVALEKVYWLKFLMTVLPITLVGEVLTFLSYRTIHDGGWLMMVAAVNVPFMSLALVSMNLGAGSFFANFKESNPIRIASSQGATLSFLVNILYLIVLVAVLFFPLFHYFESLNTSQHLAPFHFWNSLLITVPLSLALFAVSSAVGVRALKRDL